MRFARLLSAAATMAVITAGYAMSGGEPDYDLSWSTIDGGGGTSTGGTFSLSGTIGQPDAGAAMTGGTFTVVGGFWSGGSGDVTPVCPEDVNTDGMIDVNDLLAVLAAWGGCPACPEDITGDDLVNVDDLLALLAAWGPCE